jgi:hypothetical protein
MVTPCLLTVTVTSNRNCNEVINGRITHTQLAYAQ